VVVLIKEREEEYRGIEEKKYERLTCFAFNIQVLY
jgi:hypothetical protein